MTPLFVLPIPELDRPSAVGEEGRPRATSLGVAAVAVAALVVAAGVVVDQPDLILTLGLFTGLTAAGMALTDRERFVHLFFGHAFLAWFGAPLAVLVALGPLHSRAGMAVAGLAAALTALGATWGDAADRSAVWRAAEATSRTYIGLWLWLAAFAALAAVGIAGAGVFTFVTDARTAVGGTLGFLLSAGFAALGVLAGLRWLPVRQLAPRSRRPAVERATAAVRRGALLALLVVFAGGFTAVVAWETGGFEWLRAASPPTAAALVALSSRALVGPLGVVGAAALLAGLVALGVRWAARRTDPASAARIAAAVAAFPLSLVVLAGIVAFTVRPVIGIAVFVVVIAGPVLLVLLALVAFGAAELEVLPDRAGGPTLAAVGLVVAAIGAADISALLAFACVAGALVVWDVSTFGLGVTAELGRRPATRRLELVHGVLSVGVAAVAVLVVAGLDFLRTAGLGGVGGVVPALVVCLGAVLLFAPLRG